MNSPELSPAAKLAPAARLRAAQRPLKSLDPADPGKLHVPRNPDSGEKSLFWVGLNEHFPNGERHCVRVASVKAFAIPAWIGAHVCAGERARDPEQRHLPLRSIPYGEREDVYEVDERRRGLIVEWTSVRRDMILKSIAEKVLRYEGLSDLGAPKHKILSSRAAYFALRRDDTPLGAIAYVIPIDLADDLPGSWRDVAPEPLIDARALEAWRDRQFGADVDARPSPSPAERVAAATAGGGE